MTIPRPTKFSDIFPRFSEGAPAMEPIISAGVMEWMDDNGEMTAGVYVTYPEDHPTPHAPRNAILFGSVFVSMEIPL